VGCLGPRDVGSHQLCRPPGRWGWGEEAANHAAEHLAGLAREIPRAVAAHTDEMLGAMLTLCAPAPDTPTAATEIGEAATVDALDRASQGGRRGARRRHLAEAVGSCASVDPAAVLVSVQGLFSATTGDQDHDRAVRVTMLEVLEKPSHPRDAAGHPPDYL
jgi:hypothetical protein